MREILVLSEAADEAEAAAIHYESERPGLGTQFNKALSHSFSLLTEDIVPLTTISSSLTSENVRRIIMPRFPFSIIVREISDDAIEVIAIAHHSRRPRYWQNRLNT